MSKDISKCDRDVLDQIMVHTNTNNTRSDDENEPSTDTESETTKHAKCLELEGVRLAENGDLIAAINKFTSAINLAPEWASSYNNRAQALRLKRDNNGAIHDLGKALELSGRRGRVARLAFTQRGTIHQLNGDTELAASDYKMAAELGCAFARTQLVALNPYAASCNQMLSEVTTRLQYPQEPAAP